MFDALEVFFGVDADGVVGRLGDVDVDAVLKEAKLFELLGGLKRGVREGWKLLQRGSAVGVEAEVLEVAGLAGFAGALVAVVGDGGAGEVEGASVGGGNDFDGVRVGDVFGSAGRGER